jgi:hypothetical protein
MILKIALAIALLAAQSQAPPAPAGTAPPQGRGGRGGMGSMIAQLEESGFRSIFDGQSLKGWDCDPDFWRVEQGSMVAETRPGHMPKQNIFCIWRDGKPADFDLKLQYRLTGAGGNSGVQYRSIERPDVARWVMQGYQADIDADERYTGQVYEERGRTFLANRGNFTYVGDGQ